ncbi:hypothetical protein Anapl_01445, partial [Anas platyrhynchos]
VTHNLNTTCNHFMAYQGRTPPAYESMRLHQDFSTGRYPAPLRSVPAADPLLLGDEAPVGRGLVARQPVKVIHQVPVVPAPVQPGRLEIPLD